MIFESNFFFVKIMVITKMIEKVWNFSKIGDDSNKHHGIFGILLELTLRNLIEKFISGEF